MYQKAKRMFSFDTDKKASFHSLPKSTRRKKAVCANETPDTPWRFSYVRASNSLHRYGSKSRRAFSAGDGSLGSSREDLLDAPVIPSRKKRLNVIKGPPKKYKNGSSSEDLLCESDYTEEPLSSGMPETDGSVFSSQENLSEPGSRCSANVSRFLHRHSSDKSRKVSGREASQPDSSPQTQLSSVELHHSPEEGRNVMVNSIPVNPSNEKKENDSGLNHEEVQPSLPAGDAAVSEGAVRAISQPVVSDNTQLIRQRVQEAVIRTIQRLMNHIDNVKEQVDVLEKKCIVLKETLHNLRQDHDALEGKIARLEKRSEQCVERFVDSNDHERENGSNSEEVIAKESLPSVEHVHAESTDGKADQVTTSTPISEPTAAADTTADSTVQDNEIGFTSVSSSAAGESSELLSQMNTVKKKSRRPSMFNFLAVLMVTALAWDIRSAGSFEGSKLGQTVERLGLTPYLVTAGEYARAAFIHSYRWCATNLPVYYSRGCELAGPYLLLMLEKLDWVLAYGWAAMDSAAQYIPPIKEKIESTLPGALSSVSHYGGAALQSLQDGFLYARNASSPYLAHAHEFVSTRVFVGPLAPEKLQEYVVSAAEYVSQLFLQLHSALVRAVEEANNATKAS